MNADDAILQIHNNARDLYLKGELKLAENHFRLLMEAFEAHNREFTVIYTSTISYVGKICYETGRFQEALPLMERALETDEMQLGPDNKMLAHRHGTLGLLLQDLERYPEAERHLLHALHIAEKTLGLNDQTTAALREHFRNLRKRMKD